MFGRKKVVRERKSPLPPPGVVEFVLCVYDEKHRLKHHFVSSSGIADSQHFRFFQTPEKALDHMVLREAVATRTPALVNFSYGADRDSYLHVLPYERKRGKWLFACLQVSVEKNMPMGGAAPCTTALIEGMSGLLLVDQELVIRSASAKMPAIFGYTAAHLSGMALTDLFGAADLRMISSCSADTNESILSCVFHCLDGSKRDVEVKKYTASESFTLYMICDVTRIPMNEEITAVTTRERRRIGQDLHDSIGQVLTGISLLSRSLANGLKREGSTSHEDAAQISDLADDASNQIRQISRGLMPSEVVNRGLSSSLLDLARITRESCGFECEAAIDPSIDINDGAVETHLFRIAQEAVNNAVRHSGGSRIAIEVSEVDGNPQLEVRDNGRWRNIMENGGGIGLKTMEYRASVINGQLNIGQVESGGTSVACRLEAEEYLETRVM